MRFVSSRRSSDSSASSAVSSCAPAPASLRSAPRSRMRLIERRRVAARRRDRRHRARARRWIATIDKLVPPLGIADILRHPVELLGPEVGNRRKGNSLAQHVARGALGLADRVIVMLQPDQRLDATSGTVRPARHVARRVDVGEIGRAVLVHYDAIRARRGWSQRASHRWAAHLRR